MLAVSRLTAGSRFVILQLNRLHSLITLPDYRIEVLRVSDRAIS